MAHDRNLRHSTTGWWQSVKPAQTGIPSANQRGIVLISAIFIIAILVVLGTTAIMQTSMDIKISRNYKSSVQALYSAESGIQYAIATMEAGLRNGDLDLPTTNAMFDSFIAGTGIPTGHSFSVSALSMGGPQYLIRSVGNGPENASAVVDVHLERGIRSPIAFAAFGDVRFDGKSCANVFSYDHRSGPQPGDPGFVSSGEGDIGSNGEVELKNSTYIDGDVVLGANETDPSDVADLTLPSGKHIVTGEEGMEIGWVDPDPLGVLDKPYAQKFTEVKFSNDNGAIPASLTVMKSTVTLTAGDYYFTDILLKKSGTLEIDASAGPVNIYVEGTVTINNSNMIDVMNAGNEVNFFMQEPKGGISGPDIFEAKNGSAINISGDPTDFSIFSSSEGGVRFHNSSTFKGLVYAPLSDEIELNNSSDVLGAIWGSTILMHNSGDLFYDTALRDKYQSVSNDLSIVAWREVRN